MNVHFKKLNINILRTIHNVTRCLGDITLLENLPVFRKILSLKSYLLVSEIVTIP